jgi:hypothetical protein
MRKRHDHMEHCSGIRFLYDISEMALLSDILYDWRSPNHLILEGLDARQFEEDRTTAGRT